MREQNHIMLAMQASEPMRPTATGSHRALLPCPCMHCMQCCWHDEAHAFISSYACRRTNQNHVPRNRHGIGAFRFWARFPSFRGSWVGNAAFREIGEISRPETFVNQPFWTASNLGELNDARKTGRYHPPNAHRQNNADTCPQPTIFLQSHASDAVIAFIVITVGVVRRTPPYDGIPRRNDDACP